MYTYFSTNADSKISREYFWLLSNSIVKLNMEKIELIYLLTGHSQNENDNSHSMIENTSKTKFIDTTIQCKTTIKHALIKNTCQVKLK